MEGEDEEKVSRGGRAEDEEEMRRKGREKKGRKEGRRQRETLDREEKGKNGMGKKNKSAIYASPNLKSWIRLG